jgi:hypothetical protein
VQVGSRLTSVNSVTFPVGEALAGEETRSNLHSKRMLPRDNGIIAACGN